MLPLRKSTEQSGKKEQASHWKDGPWLSQRRVNEPERRGSLFSSYGIVGTRRWLLNHIALFTATMSCCVMGCQVNFDLRQLQQGFWCEIFAIGYIKHGDAGGSCRSVRIKLFPLCFYGIQNSIPNRTSLQSSASDWAQKQWFAQDHLVSVTPEQVRPRLRGWFEERGAAPKH